MPSGLRSCLLVAAVALGFALCGCQGKKISDIGAPSPPPTGPAWTIPLGVAATPGAELTSEVGGLYPSGTRNDKTCCWVAPHATLQTLKSGPASTLAVSIYVPDFKFFSAHPQRFHLSLAGGPTVERCCFAPGIHELTVDVPPAERAATGTLPLEIDSSYAFVPANEHVNADTRPLGTVVLRVDYRT